MDFVRKRPNEMGYFRHFPLKWIVLGIGRIRTHAAQQLLLLSKKALEEEILKNELVDISWLKKYNQRKQRNISVLS